MLKLTLFAILLLSLLWILKYIYDVFYTWWRTRHIPGPTYFLPTTIFSNAMHPDNFISNSLGQWANYKKFGNLWKVNVGRQSVIFVASAEEIRNIMQKKSKSFIKPQFYAKIMNFNWNCGNLFMSDGQDWKRHRDLLSPSFSDKSLADIFEKNILTQIPALIHEVRMSTFVNVSELFNLFSFDIICKAGFGYDMKALKNKDHTTLEMTEILLSQDFFYYIIPEILWPLLKIFPFNLVPWFKLYFNNLKSWGDFIGNVVDSKTDEDSADLLTRMKNAVLDGDRLNRNELIADSNVMLVAGHETAANTLVRAFYYISLNPEVHRKLQEEADSFDWSQTSWESFSNHFTYTKCVMYETLRVHSPSHGALRQLAEDIEISGYKIPKGVLFFNLDFIAAMDPQIWGSSSNDFKPERFERPDIRKLAYFPFSVGPRTCIGKLMAEMEIVSTIGSLMRKFNVKIDPKKVSDYAQDKIQLLRKPKYDIHLDFIERK